MSLGQGTIVTITRETNYHPFSLGDTVVIWRKCIEGYKVLSSSEDLDKEEKEWYYVEEVDIELV